MVLARELFSWAESLNPDLRRAASGRVIEILSSRQTGGEHPVFLAADSLRVRHILLAAAEDPAQDGRQSIPDRLEDLLDNLDADDARRMADVAELKLSTYKPTDMDLLLRVADLFEELRPRAIAQLLGPDLDAASAIAEGGRPWPHRLSLDWLEKAARDWIRSLEDEDLRDDETQERFLIVVKAAHLRRAYWGLNLPASHRQPPGSVRVPVPAPWQRYAAAAADDEQTEDLKAFGLPPPAKPAVAPDMPRPAEPQQTPAPPLTAQEKTVRWQRFVLARASVVRALGERAD
jgi:hypothetical protein